jgi:NitT/TauT family transport system substrate-binding protein
VSVHGDLRALLIALGVGLLLTAAGCQGPTSPARTTPGAAPAAAAPVATVVPAPAREPDAVRLATTMGFVDAPIMMALDKGYLQEQGLDVQIEPIAGAADVVAFLGTGELDLAHGGISPALFNALERGVTLRVIAPMNILPLDNGSTQVLVGKDLADRGEIRGPADLQGRRVAVNTSGSLVSWQLDKVLEPHGLSILDVERVIVPFPDMPAALANGSVDAAIVIDPWLTRAVSDGIAARLVTRTVPGAMTTSMIASGKLVSERPDVARRFIIGLTRGVRAIQPPRLGVVDPALLFTPDHIAIYQKYMNVPEQLLRAQSPSTWDPDMEIPTDTIAEQQLWFMRYGQLSYSEPLPISAVVEPSFVRAAQQALGRVRS